MKENLGKLEEWIEQHDGIPGGQSKVKLGTKLAANCMSENYITFNNKHYLNDQRDTGE